MNAYRLALLLIGLVLTANPNDAQAAAPTSDVGRLSRQLAPFLDCFTAARTSFAVSAEAEIPIDGHQEQVTLHVERMDDESFDLEIKHERYWVKVQRRADRTVLVLPLHKVAFLGDGPTPDGDTLAPKGISRRLSSSGSTVSTYLPLLANSDPTVVSLLLTHLLKLRYDAESNSWSQENGPSLQFGDSRGCLTVQSGDVELDVRLAESKAISDSPILLDGLKIVSLDRGELERHLTRAVRRGLEVLAPSPLLTSPAQENRQVPHGELRWVDGQRVVLLHGTPEQIGRAHGMLLCQEAGRCIDSVLHMFGTAQTIQSGRWFPHDLQAAYRRLAPHIPDDHKRETHALALALGRDPQLMQAVSVFPELFHCSGFAVFGKATRDGRLYHGRVLDYMTVIGLQDAATTFVVAVDGKIPFVNVGYGGFIGSVSGMNAKGISLGEMGGRGEGKWDGVPMATLMRRALEECGTLNEVKNLWTNSPRTCEYYYVFADGKTNEAVGVAATPDSIEFINPGQSHPLLGDGVDDTVILSAGDRLERLRSRVKSRYGQIDASVGQWLMSRPVAMSSNLHNVLFVPEERVLYVANADHERPAADRPYVRLDLTKLLASMAAPEVQAAAP
jgi:hypothetical protein